MNPELGHFALILAFGVALLLGTLPLAGAQSGNLRWMVMAGPLSVAQFALVAIAFASLATSFLADDFSVAAVASGSNTLLPAYYKFSAVWGAHEGSMLLWQLVLTLWTLAVAAFSASLPRDVRARVLAVLGLVSVGLLAFILLTSNPFERTFPNVPMEGRDLNPLLQDIGLVLHPPILYLGYVGFSVAFAFAIAALLSGRLDAAWARWSRPWTTAAWIFLTVGIALGSWWAYYELGWGGWWFWDPVENASFMPWLAGTALLHSLAVTEKRGLFKSWTVLLAILAFSLSLLGTFLVRSGVLTSVHSFASDPARGVYILLFLAVVVGGSLILYALRAPRIGADSTFRLLSRETALMGNNLLLVVALATVLVGTLYPLVMTTFDLGRMSVGPPYFNLTFLPMMSLLVLLMGVGPLLTWRDSPAQRLLRLVVPFLVGLSLAVVVPFLYGGAWHAGAALTVFLAVWVVASLVSGIVERIGSIASWRKLGRLGLGYWGMVTAHLGIAICVVGVGFSSTYSVERDLRMAPGDSVEMAGWQFRFIGIEQRQGANYIAEAARFKVGSLDGELSTMVAEKRSYRSQMGNVMTEAAIDGGLFRDLYVSLGEPLGGGDWAVRLYVKPFQRWIWLGPLVMAAGGLLAIADRRYRALLSRRSVALPVNSQPA